MALCSEIVVICNVWISCRIVIFASETSCYYVLIEVGVYVLLHQFCQDADKSS